MRTATLAGSLLALAAAAPALAAPEQERASRALRKVAKEFQRLRSYRVDVEVEGGKARGAEHRIYERTVSESYRAEVLGKVCRVTSPAAFRLRTDSLTGAVSDGGSWKAILATSDGRLVARLFEPPEKHLAMAYRLKRNARWVDPAEDAGEPPGPGSVVPSRTDDGPQGTQERDGPSSAGRDEEEPLSHHLRVVGPAEVALEQFITITNSGCFSEG